MVSPKHLIARPKTPNGFDWVIRTRNPFLLVRVQQTGQYTATLSPWPVTAFSALSEAKQNKLIQSAGAAWFIEAGVPRIMANRTDCRCTILSDVSPPPILFATAQGVRYIVSTAEPLIASVTNGELTVLFSTLDGDTLHRRLDELHQQLAPRQL